MLAEQTIGASDICRHSKMHPKSVKALGENKVSGGL
jgi:hypothetical protein